MEPITWSFGMQSRPSFHIGDHPDLEGAVEAAAQAGMKEAIIFGKDHTGFCFHPTKIGVTHPHLKINLTRDMTTLLHQHGMRSIAYVNFGLDGEMGRRHAEWLQEKNPGEYTLYTEDHFVAMCIFSEYTDRYLIPMLEEMFHTCDVDGLFMDCTTGFDPCYCPHCEAAFQKEFGRSLPLKSAMDDPGWKLYGQWQYRRSEEFIRKIREKIHAIKADAPVIFNHVGGILFPHPMPGVLDGKVSGDPLSFFPTLSCYANYFSSMPNTSDVFIERFARGWGDRGACDDLTMEYKSAIIFMYRCRFCVGDRMHPDGRLAPGSKHAMELISSVWHQMNQYLTDSLEADPDFLLLFPESCRSGRNREDFTGFLAQHESRKWSAGAYRMLLDCGRSFMHLPEFVLERHLRPGRTLILSDVLYLRPETDQAIRNFLKAGGTVLCAGNPPKLFDETIPDWIGVKMRSSIPVQNTVYLPDLTPREADTERVMARGNIQDVEADGAEVLLRGYPQDYAETLKKTTYPYYNSSSPTPMETPLLTCCRYGQGKVYYLNCNIFWDYEAGPLPDLRKWMSALLRKIHPEASYELSSSSGNVEIASYKDGENASVHILVNHGGREATLNYYFKSEYLFPPQPAYPLTLKIRSEKPLHFFINGKPVESSWSSGIASIDLVMDSVWKAIRVESC